MNTNIQSEKTKCPKNNASRTFTARIAEIVGCSPRMVRYVQTGKRSANRLLGEKIEVAATIYQDEERKAFEKTRIAIATL